MHDFCDEICHIFDIGYNISEEVNKSKLNELLNTFNLLASKSDDHYASTFYSRLYRTLPELNELQIKMLLDNMKNSYGRYTKIPRYRYDDKYDVNRSTLSTSINLISGILE